MPRFLRLPGFGLFAAVLAVGALPLHASSIFTISLQQVGTNVVASGSGTVDLTGLSLLATAPSLGAEISPGTAGLGLGSATGDESLYSGIVGPTYFGFGGLVSASGGTGSSVLLDGNSSSFQGLFLPSTYVSGSSLTAGAIWNNETFASLLVTTGTYTWTWDGGANSVVLYAGTAPPSPVPEPSSILLLGTGLLAIIGLGWRRRPGGGIL